MNKAVHRKDNPPNVDELYGLEPVIEPGGAEDGSDGHEGVQARAVQCPYCGETFDTAIDLSAGSTSYIEDCQVCCQPIEFRLEVADDGTLASLETRRSD
ncbi:MAG TPA: CPXCG motif-containing cysteine-rich protein [Steroidobacteraceae bacterium]|nr:CPXCG motif-containing cysteine-rich protein [Steroidobacteraceae bacterium]